MISTVENSTLLIRFAAPWSLEDYAHFIRSKNLPEAEILFDEASDVYTVRAPARFAHLMGLAAVAEPKPPLPLPGWLLDYQAFITQRAFAAKRFAVWSDCGTGKTPIQLELARQAHHATGGRVGFVAPPEVVKQTVKEAEKFYPDGSVRLHRFTTRAEFAAWCKGELDVGTPYGITNYEKFIDGVMPELRWLSALIADESSILKSGGGVIKWNLIKSARGIEYKWSLTATPAPNDTMEYASQASFLEKLRSEGEILWTYFARDAETQAWKVKPHAREAFYRFMASWSIYLRKPGLYGFKDPFAHVPEPSIIEHRVAATPAQLRARAGVLGARAGRTGDGAQLIEDEEKLGVVERQKLSQLAKGFRYVKGIGGAEVLRVDSLKPAFVAERVRAHVAAGRQVLVWCIYDEEARIVERLLRGVARGRGLHGFTPEGERERILQQFRAGELRWLVSKAKLLGYGMNFQFCTAMVFSGFDDSFEAFYQAVRRSYRYGSTQQLHVDVPYVPECESHVWANILRKRDNWETDTAECEKAYAAAALEQKGRAA